MLQHLVASFIQTSPGVALSQVCALCWRSFVPITQTKRQEQDG